MDPSRKRRIRLVVALSVAVLLASGLAYTSFSAATEAKQPSEALLVRDPEKKIDLTGRVARDSVSRSGSSLRFVVSDRGGRGRIPVRYSGTVPDPFREGREVIVTGRVVDGTLMAERDSLVTKCPSKFSDRESPS